MKQRNSAAREKLIALYDEAEIDWIAFGQIIDLVSYGEAVRLGSKAPQLRFDHSIKLAKFLVHSGDFVAGRLGSPNTECDFVAFFGGLEEFIECATEIFVRGGINDPELSLGIWFDKISDASSPLEIPGEIDAILSGYSN